MALQNHPKICPICEKGKRFVFIRDFRKEQNKYSLYQCLECQVKFWEPMKNPGNKWYEDNNPYKIRDILKPKIFRGYHKDFLKRHKSFLKDTKILDLGCGTGEFIAELEKRGCQVWGVDFDKEAVRIAKKRFGLKNIYDLSLNEFLQKNDLPKFDIIVFFEVIEHLDNPLEFIQNIKKLLKPSGKIVLSTPYRERMLSDSNNWDFPPHHFTRWNEETIANIFKKQDFYISRVDYVEQFKILSESVGGRFKTGLVNKSLSFLGNKKRFLIFPKIIYFLGRLKHLFIGKVPASFLWIFAKATNRKNGIMLIELERKNQKDIIRKKIIFLTPTLGGGGGERLVSELSLNLPVNIQRIIVVLESIENKISYSYVGKLVSLNLLISNNFLLKAYSFFSGLFQLKKIIKKEKPNYVISFGGQLNIMNILAGRKAIVRVENFIPMTNSLREKIYGILIRVLFNKSNKIIVVSQKIANSLVKNFGIKKEKIELIYNPIDIKKIQNLASEPLEPKFQEIFKSPVIINIGRFAQMKGQWHLIRAFREVKNRVEEAKLVILGKGELESRFRGLIKDLNLENDVYLLGWQKNPFKFLAKSKLFVLSSLGGEGLPYVILEAMACGLPIVSVDCKSGPREILAPKTNSDYQTKNIEYAQYGILTPVCNGKLEEKILSEAIVDALSNKGLLNGLINKSKQRSEDFDIKEIMKEWDFLSN